LAGLLFAGPAFAVDRTAVPELFDGAPTYVRFDPIFVPVIVGDRVTRQVGVSLMLELAKGQAREDVEDKERQLNDAFVKNLYVYFQQRAGSPGDIDQAYLKGQLLKAAAAVVGPHVVKQVLIEQLFEERK
jgi:hypothetical protein